MTKVTAGDTGKRKEDHIRINLEENVQFPLLTTGLEDYYFIHQALPELDLDQIDTSLTLFGRTLAAPILVSSMTGGTQQAGELNQRLAEAAQQYRLAMGVGSQRAAIENPDLASTFQIRKYAPDILLFANLGAVQLNYGYGIDQCQRAIEMIGADALILHLNVLQEAVQPEGDIHWNGLLKQIGEICNKLDVPVVVKEVGWGLSDLAARQLMDAGVAALDVAGSGGTSWSEVEYHRAPSRFHAEVARAFADWGIPTAHTLKLVKQITGDLPVFASGGLKDGIDIAKCIALGATLCGIAGPLLRAAAESTESLDETIRILIRQLHIAMLCCSSADLAHLAQVPIHHRFTK